MHIHHQTTRILLHHQCLPDRRLWYHVGMYNLDQTWIPFSSLMLRHIYNVLLVCSDYDRFMLEEDGRVEEELYKEYMELGLSTPPKITHTSSTEEAMDLIGRLSFDLVITMIDFHSGKVEAFARKVKSLRADMPVIVLAPSPDHRRMKALKEESCDAIDQIFYWQGDATLFLAMVKLIEDSLNLDHDTSVADVQVIVLIEDSIHFISSYLPVMYTSLIKQTRLSILEALNEWGKTLRMRGRPKIVLARSGEQALEYYRKYRRNILGIITDVNFPYEGQREGSGLRLARQLRDDDPDLPILIQSTDISNAGDAAALKADFIWKNSPNLLSSLEDHFIRCYNFGPFDFIDPASGEKILSARTMKEVQNAIRSIPAASLLYHSKRNDFSRWLRAQSMYQLASIIEGINVSDDGGAEELRSRLYNAIREYRIQRTRGAIAQFSPDSYDDTSFFSRIGSGSLGGKGRGLAFIAAEMMAAMVQSEFPSIYLSIPKTVVVSTRMYDEFLSMHGFDISSLTRMDDAGILQLFLSKDIPPYLEQCLREFLKVVVQPLSVRSSSLLEDSHSEPFAGVYQTCMITNAGSDEERLRELSDAIRTVWASVFFSRAREYLKMTEHMVEEEKMAVILQQVTGSRHGRYYYPNVSGVARSLNYYPVSGQKSEDGVAMVSFGFGKSVVDDGASFRFCPAKPKKPSDDLNGNAAGQDRFYALDMETPFDPRSNIDNLVLLPMSEAEKYPRSLKYIASTLDMTTYTLSESSSAEGQKIITFNGMLKYDMFPLAQVIDRILKLGSKSMNTPVEIEIAVNTERSGEKKPDFSILQIRPIASAYTESDVEVDEHEAATSIVYSTSVMGNGIVEGIRDIVAIRPETFKASEMSEMAAELAGFNASLEDREYVLIVAGRLGSTDRWLGIPCAWSDISHARVIVETGLPDMQVEPSQGTHFFQNMTSLGCLYLTVNPVFGQGRLDFGRLEDLELVAQSGHFSHYRADEDLEIKANGLARQAVIRTREEIVRWD